MKTHILEGPRPGDVDAGRLRLHYVEAGEGEPPVVLLHGFPEFHGSWRYQIPYLARHFRTIAFDLPGYGRSEAPRRGFSIPKLVDDIVCALEALGVRRTHLVGHDWGGVLAWAAGALVPERIARLVILNAPHPVGFLRGLTPSQMRRSWYMLWFQVPRLPERALWAFDHSAMFSAMERAGGPGYRLTPEEKASYRAAFPDPASFRAPLAYYRTAFRSGLFSLPRLARPIAAPTLVLWGEKDGALGKHLVAGFDRYAPDLEKRFFPEAGHWVHQEEPDAVNEAILEFLRR